MTQATNGLTSDSGYLSFKLGEFSFSRDDYFVHLAWPRGSHMLPADRFLRALMRDVAWNFFYGIVNFDEVFGTVNHYGTVKVFAGSSIRATAPTAAITPKCFPVAWRAPSLKRSWKIGLTRASIHLPLRRKPVVPSGPSAAITFPR